MRPTVAQVTDDEPDSAAMIPQPTTLTCRSRPGSQATQGARPENNCSDRRERNRISPIQMKSGSAVSAQFQLASQTVVAKTGPTGAGENRAIATRPTPIRDSATQRPLPSNRNMQETTMAAATIGWSMRAAYRARPVASGPDVSASAGAVPCSSAYSSASASS